MRLVARENALLEELAHLADPQERLAAAVDHARRLPRFTAEQRNPAARVPGCSSNVWLLSESREGRCYFLSDADSPVVRGLVGLLTGFFSGATPAEIVASRADPLQILDLNRTLTPTRQHGLAAVRAAIQAFARAGLSPAVNPATVPPNGKPS